MENSKQDIAEWVRYTRQEFAHHHPDPEVLDRVMGLLEDGLLDRQPIGGAHNTWEEDQALIERVRA